jgi:hypothetical protein
MNTENEKKELEQEPAADSTPLLENKVEPENETL